MIFCWSARFSVFWKWNYLRNVCGIYKDNFRNVWENLKNCQSKCLRLFWTWFRKQNSDVKSCCFWSFFHIFVIVLLIECEKNRRLHLKASPLDSSPWKKKERFRYFFLRRKLTCLLTKYKQFLLGILLLGQKSNYFCKPLLEPCNPYYHNQQPSWNDESIALPPVLGKNFMRWPALIPSHRNVTNFSTGEFIW